MIDSSGSCFPLPQGELVQKRIDERRLFEAQFFFNKFSSEIDSPVREQLDQQLTTRILLAKQVFTKGEYLEQAGELEKARTVYAELAEIAVDYPSLDQVRQRVEVAIKLGSFQQAGPGEPAKEKTSPAKIPISVTSIAKTIKPDFKRLTYLQRNKIPLAIACALFVALALFVGLLLFRSGGVVDVTKDIQPMAIPPKRDEPAVVHPPIQPVPQPVVPIELPEVGSATTDLLVQPAVPAAKTKVVEEKYDSNSLNINTITVEEDTMPSPQLIVPDESDLKQAATEQKKSRLRIRENIILIQ